jgi:hypothetical protein
MAPIWNAGMSTASARAAAITRLRFMRNLRVFVYIETLPEVVVSHAHFLCELPHVRVFLADFPLIKFFALKMGSNTLISLAFPEDNRNSFSFSFRILPNFSTLTNLEFRERYSLSANALISSAVPGMRMTHLPRDLSSVRTAANSLKSRNVRFLAFSSRRKSVWKPLRIVSAFLVIIARLVNPRREYWAELPRNTLSGADSFSTIRKLSRAMATWLLRSCDIIGNNGACLPAAGFEG